MISSSELDTFQAVVYQKTDSIACQDDLFGPIQSTQPGLSFGASRPISVLYAQLSPRPKHCGQTLPDGKLFFFLFLSGAEESASCVVFQRPCPAGDRRQSAALSDADFCHHFPFSPGALPRLPTDLENASVHFVCLLALTHHTLAQQSIVAA